jgi:HEAT repeat protein
VIAWIVLSCLQDPEVDALIRDLASARRTVRDAAAARLAETGPRRWKEYEERAAGHSDARIRETLSRLAAEGRRRDPDRVMAALDEILEERRWARGLPLPGRFEDTLRSELRKRDLEPLPETLSRALLACFERLDGKDETPILMASLANSLGATSVPETRGEVRRVLVALLGFEDPIVQSSAVDALASMSATEEAEALSAAAREGAAVVRIRAVRALAALRVGMGTLRALLSDPDWRLREAALRGLDEVEPDGAREAVAGRAEDEAVDVRRLALRIAQRWRDGVCTAAAAARLEDGDASVRAEAVRYFGKLRDPAHEEGVAGRLGDPDARVRRAAAAAIAMLGAKGRADELARLLADPSPPVVQEAVRALGSLGATEHADAIARLFRNNAVRYAAYQAVGLLRAERHAPALIAAARSLDDDVTNRALIALGRMRASSAVPALLETLDNPRRAQPCAYAILALANLRHSDSAPKVFEAAGQAQSSRIPIALDAYHVLALDARDEKRIEQALRDPAGERGWFVQLALNLASDLTFSPAQDLLFDPDCGTIGELVEEIRRQLRLEIRFELAPGALAEPLEIRSPLPLREALQMLAATLGYRVGIVSWRGRLRLLPPDRAREYWLGWMAARY